MPILNWYGMLKQELGLQRQYSPLGYFSNFFKIDFQNTGYQLPTEYRNHIWLSHTNVIKKSNRSSYSIVIYITKKLTNVAAETPTQMLDCNAIAIRKIISKLAEEINPPPPYKITPTFKFAVHPSIPT